MAVTPRLMFLIGAIVSLGACSDQQVSPLQERSTYSHDPAIVRKVQVALRERGYYAGLVDGFLGQDTATGIERFQVDHDIAVVPRIDRSLLVSLGIRSNR
jgi:peptidoglycan hydrolase-like protein with peptidoglycan-binding domain